MNRRDQNREKVKKKEKNILEMYVCYNVPTLQNTFSFFENMKLSEHINVTIIMYMTFHFLLFRERELS